LSLEEQEALQESVARFPALLRKGATPTVSTFSMLASTNSADSRETAADSAAAPLLSVRTAGLDAEHIVLKLIQKMSASHSAQEAAEVLAVGLAAKLGCERVMVGQRKELSTALLASSEASLKASSAGATSEILLAMDEAIDQACTLLYPADAARSLCLLAAHMQLSEATRAVALCTVPLAWQGKIFGAILAERRQGSPFDGDEIAVLEQSAAAAAAWLRLQQRAEMSWRERAWLSVRTAFGKAGQGRFRLAGVGVVLVLAVLFGWPVEREIAAPVKLEGSIQRVVTAPGDSYIEKVHVRPGDVVKTGQLLVEFAAEDLRVERQRLTAELGAHDAASADAMSKQDLGTLAVQSAKVRESQAQLELLDQRLARLRVTAPFDAVVIQGDLSNALGAPIKKGEVLMTLAPADSFRAIVEIDEGDIGEIHAGQAGAMVLTALPYATLPLRVKDIIPLAVVAQGRSYFEAEVELLPLAEPLSELRPGMRGIARLLGPQRARGLVWIEKASVWMRLAWWRWVGR
jgi:multidrug resistance efflux pump